MNSPRFYALHKNELNMDHRSGCASKTMQLLEDNIEENRDDLKFVKGVLDTTPSNGP